MEPEFNYLGKWLHVVDISKVPFFKKPMAKLGKALNEATMVTLNPDNTATFVMRGTTITGRWRVENGRFHLDTGHGPESTGIASPGDDIILMDSAQGEYGAELSRAKIYLTRA